MAKETYDIQELVTQSGVPRRTIYFYVQQGVLPPPEGAGLAAHYTDDHLLRLRLIPVLREQGLRLDEIRVRFSELSGDEMRAMVNANQRPPAPAPVQRAVREPFAPEIKPGFPPPTLPVGWEQQRFTQYNLPAGIALIAPENLSMADRGRLNQLLQAAQQIFSGMPVVYMEASQGPATNDTAAKDAAANDAAAKDTAAKDAAAMDAEGSKTPGVKNTPEEE